MEINTLDQTISIDIDTSKKIGVLLSGGMDSAIMLFLLLKEIKDNNLTVDLTVYNVPNVNDNAAVYAGNIVEFLEKYFNTDIKFKSIGNGHAEPLKLIRQPAAEILATKEIDIIYSGQNQFPPEARLWTAYKSAQGKFIRRDPRLPDPDNVRFPFVKLYKNHILDLYRQFNILELAAITHSCTAQKTGTCKECLWCVERTWAFTQLGLTDDLL
jgi:hypothetical protein